jgi:hypothetical protein
MSKRTEDDILNGSNEVAAAIVLAGRAIAKALHALPNHALTEGGAAMGGLEFLAVRIGDQVGGGLESMASAVREIADNIGGFG